MLFIVYSIAYRIAVLFLKEPLTLLFKYYKSAIMCQIDSYKVSNSNLKPDLCNCAKTEIINFIPETDNCIEFEFQWQVNLDQNPTLNLHPHTNPLPEFSLFLRLILPNKMFISQLDF